MLVPLSKCAHAGEVACLAWFLMCLGLYTTEISRFIESTSLLEEAICHTFWLSCGANVSIHCNYCHKGVEMCSYGRRAVNTSEIRGGTWSTKHVFWVCYVASATFIFVSGSIGDVTDSTQLMHSTKHVPPLPPSALAGSAPKPDKRGSTSICFTTKTESLISPAIASSVSKDSSSS